MSIIRYTGKAERVILGKYMYPKETREVPEALAEQLAKDNKDIEIVGEKKPAKKKPTGKKEKETLEPPQLPLDDQQPPPEG